MVRPPFHPRVSREAIVAWIEANPLGEAPEDMRPAFEALMRGNEDAPEKLSSREDGSVRFTGRDEGLIVHFHGGGYVFGSPDSHARFGAHLCEASGWDVLLPAYPLAPEHRWPAQLEFALKTVRRASKDRRIVLSGDSAGGHLALVTALALAKRGEAVDGLVLMSPNTDRTGRSTTRRINEDSDPMVDDAGDRRLAAMCFGDMPDDHLEVSPLLDDLALLPPTHVEAGTGEVLLDDARLLARKGREAGADIAFREWKEGLHMGQLWAPYWKDARASLTRIAAFVRRL